MKCAELMRSNAYCYSLPCVIRRDVFSRRRKPDALRYQKKDDVKLDIGIKSYSVLRRFPVSVPKLILSSNTPIVGSDCERQPANRILLKGSVLEHRKKTAYTSTRIKGKSLRIRIETPVLSARIDQNDSFIHNTDIIN